MATFRISPHMRLQEWVADAEGFFTAEGLDYEFAPTLHLIGAPSVSSSETLPAEWRRGAFETFVQGRPCDISSACHWVTNVAAVGGNGRMWGQAYSVCPSAVFVPPESAAQRPEDLAGVEVTVGYHSGSHFSTLQALESVLPSDQIKLRFTGPPFERMAALLERKVPAAATFGLAYYVLEQQGFRKVLDTTFMMGFQVTSDASQDDLERYFRALGRAQQAIDLEPERHKHYFLRELPEQYHPLFDPRLAGTGERIVFQPYTREIFERTYRWVVERGLFGADEVGTVPYAQAIVGSIGMFATRFTERLGIAHPIALGGMGTGTNAALVSAVCNAGGLGVLGTSSLTADGIRREAALIRQQTDRPFGINFLLAFVNEERFLAGLEAGPAVLSFAWPRPEQDLADYFARSHAAGAAVMHMVSTAEDGRHAAEAGADVIVAQGTEGGGHVGQMASMVLLPQTVSAVPDRPVLAAGGVADGRGLAAALALGADGVLLGTRFLATPEAPIPEGYKQAIVDSDGTDSVLSDIADIISGRDWPGALNRVKRNRFLETWIGREYEVRRRRVELQAHLRRAWEAGDAEQGSIGTGQVAGLVDSIAPAADLVRTIAAEAEQIIAGRLPALLRAEQGSATPR